MSLITTKRFQQGVFEALASQNRAYGSGGGSGIGISSLGAVSIGSQAGITTSGVVVTGSTVNFMAPPGVTSVLVLGTLNVGSNCAVGSFNTVTLAGSAGLTPQVGVWPYALLDGAGVGTINYFPVTLLSLVSTTPDFQSVNWTVNATVGSVSVNNGWLYVFGLR